MDLTEMTATALRASIRERKNSVVEVVDAHLERIGAVNDELNAVIWPLVDEARVAARRADDLLARGEATGMLFGVPMTIKDQFKIASTPTSVGLARLSKRSLKDEGSLITRLREQGAIFLGKTNVPQLLLTHECEHGLYGHCKNPHDPSRVPGGSSGGEAAIIAAHGSPLGLGSDMGGSIRIPAHCCGVCGLKPTASRFTNDDSPLSLESFGGFAGFEGFVVQPGPMARSVDDLGLMMNALLGTPLPPSDDSPPVPWRVEPIVPAESLRVGIYTDDGFFPASAAVQRVVNEAGAALEAAGFVVEPFAIPGGSEPLELAYDMLCAAGDVWLKKALAGDEPTVTIKGLLQSMGLPNAMRRPMSSVMSLLGQERTATLMRHSYRRDANTYWELTARRNEYRVRFRRAMERQQLDALLCPSYGLPAPQLDSNESGVVSLAGSYSMLYNFLGLPAGTVPFGVVRKDEEGARPPSRDGIDRAAAAIDRGSAGLPIGVQVVGRRWEEGTVLSLMKQLETLRK